MAKFGPIRLELLIAITIQKSQLYNPKDRGPFRKLSLQCFAQAEPDSQFRHANYLSFYVVYQAFYGPDEIITFIQTYIGICVFFVDHLK